MPRYTFICNACESTTDIIARVDNRPESIPCDECGAKMGRLYTPPQINSFRSYVTKHFDGQPVEVRTPAQESSLFSKYGVYRPEEKEDVEGRAQKNRKRNQQEQYKGLGDMRDQYNSECQKRGIRPFDDTSNRDSRLQKKNRRKLREAKQWTA